MSRLPILLILLLFSGLTNANQLLSADDFVNGSIPSSQTPTNPQPEPRPQANNSATEVTMRLGGSHCAGMTDEEMERWQRWGIKSFTCNVKRFRTLGGTQEFTGDFSADLSSNVYQLQRLFLESTVIARAKARGMKMYLDFYLVNYWNTSTPLSDWFDDENWNKELLPRIRDLSAFAGLFMDLGRGPGSVARRLDPLHRGSWSSQATRTDCGADPQRDRR